MNCPSANSARRRCGAGPTPPHPSNREQRPYRDSSQDNQQEPRGPRREKGQGKPPSNGEPKDTRSPTASQGTKAKQASKSRLGEGHEQPSHQPGQQRPSKHKPTRRHKGKESPNATRNQPKTSQARAKPRGGINPNEHATKEKFGHEQAKIGQAYC